jgi:MAF protein
MTEIILASKSPRRQKLLRKLFDHFLIISAEVDEIPHQGEDPESYVIRLAKEKAISAADKIPPNADLDFMVIGADTIVLSGSEILGKPIDEEDARRILEKLRDSSHLVLSAIALVHLPSREVRTRIVKSDVEMRNYSDEEIKTYILSGDPLDKAGAYAIQNRSFNPVPEYNDCFANVMGLPLCDLYLLMKAMGVKTNNKVAENCQEFLEYNCPVYKKRLSSTSG